MEKLIENIALLRNSYEYGKNVINDFKDRGEEIPQFVYDRMIELMDDILNEIDKRRANA